MGKEYFDQAKPNALGHVAHGLCKGSAQGLRRHGNLRAQAQSLASLVTAESTAVIPSSQLNLYPTPRKAPSRLCANQASYSQVAFRIAVRSRALSLAR